MESLEIEVLTEEIRIMDSCGFDGDDQPKIDALIEPGIYQVQATYEKGSDTWATVFQLTRINAANNTSHTNP